MSTLVIQLPPRARQPGGADGSAAPARAAIGELAFVLTPDGLAVSKHGRAAAALLPKADTVVVVVADTDLSWHRIKLPKAPAARLRAAVAGVLEEQLLDEPEALHLAVAPDAAGEMAGLMAVLSLIAVVYVGLVAMVQEDMKKLIAYSSIAHMGFVTLGFFLPYWGAGPATGESAGLAMAMTASSSPCMAGVMPVAFAAAVWEGTQ